MRRPLVFICHSSTDKPFVKRLEKRLLTDGIDTWVDHLEIRIGDSIHDKINEGLSKSDFLIIVLSKASIESRWVREELNSAASLEKLNRKGVFILPLLLEHCNVPPLLLDRRYANFVEDIELGYQELRDSIFHHFKDKHPDVDVSAITPPKLQDVVISPLLTAENLLTLPPRLFEQLIAFLFEGLGFSVELTSVTRDGGADVIAFKSPAPGLSQIKTIIECKRYTTNKKVGVDIVRQLIGAMHSFKAPQGIIVTTSFFTNEAELLASSSSIDLIDRGKLLKMLNSISAGTWTSIFSKHRS